MGCSPAIFLHNCHAFIKPNPCLFPKMKQMKSNPFCAETIFKDEITSRPLYNHSFTFLSRTLFIQLTKSAL